MSEFTPSHSISRYEASCQVHFAISGYWKLEDMHGFLEELNEAALPFVKARKPIYVLGDMNGFKTQDRETGQAIRDHLLQSQKYGLQRVAIISPDTLVKMQYRRLSEGVDVMFFDDKAEAFAWLRSPLDA